MSRRRVRLLIALGVIVFLAVSFDLARWLSLENVERSAIVKLLDAEMRGDAASMFAQLHDCTPACRADVRYDAGHLVRPGSLQILADSSATAYSHHEPQRLHARRLEVLARAAADRAVRGGVAQGQRDLRSHGYPAASEPSDLPHHG